MCEKALKHVFEDTYYLFKKTINYHWNVRSKSFMELHLLFGKQYGELLEATDLIAEHMRAKDILIEGKCSEICPNLTPINALFSDQEMLKDLYLNHVKIIEYIRQEVAQMQMKDISTQDLLIERCREHEKMAWMLKSYL